MSEHKIIDGDALYHVEAACPHCGQTQLVPMGVQARLERTRDDAKLGLKVSQKKQDHKCGQTALTVVAETGEVISLDLDGGQR